MVIKKPGVPEGTLSSDFLFGVVSAAICLPVAMSFTNIIFHDPAFTTHLPKLHKLMLLSCCMHQICFSLFSCMPFAIGQVQDAGLIFLSVMAESVVHQLGPTDDALLPTTLVLLCMSTAALGVVVMLVGHFRLGKYIKLLPTCVIGGYLAYIGFFCGQAALGLMAGTEITKLAHWVKLLDLKVVGLVAPGVAGGVLCYLWLTSSYSTAYTLPQFMGLFLVSFFVVIYSTGMTLEDARVYGWVSPMEHLALSEARSFDVQDLWSDYNLSLVRWDVFPSQFSRFVGLCMTVAFSSGLDVAAIELELEQDLDNNAELKTVGVSNLVSGLTGGFSGSYIFSQTIFCMRRGVASSITGICVIFAEIIFVFAPFSLDNYLPKSFFGALLCFIAIDLMTEWLFLAQSSKFTPAEFKLCVFSFVCIVLAGVQVGMLVGIAVYLYVKPATKEHKTVTTPNPKAKHPATPTNTRDVACAFVREEDDRHVQSEFKMTTKEEGCSLLPSM